MLRLLEEIDEILDLVLVLVLQTSDLVILSLATGDFNFFHFEDNPSTIAQFAVVIPTGGATIAMQLKNRYLGILTRYQGTVQNILTPSPAKIETLLCKLCYLDYWFKSYGL